MVYNPNQSIDVSQASKMIPRKSTGNTRYGGNIPTVSSIQAQAPKPQQPIPKAPQPTQQPATKSITQDQVGKLIQRAESEGQDGRQVIRNIVADGYKIIDDPKKSFGEKYDNFIDNDKSENPFVRATK